MIVIRFGVEQLHLQTAKYEATQAFEKVSIMQNNNFLFVLLWYSIYITSKQFGRH